MFINYTVTARIKIGLILFTILILISASTIATSINYQHQVNELTFTTDNGLPDDYVARLRVDNAGFIWLVTNSSLVRFDGIRFNKYSLNNERIAGFYKSYSDDSIYVQTLTEKIYTVYNGNIRPNYWIKNHENICFLEGGVAYLLNKKTKRGINYLNKIIPNKDDLFSTINHNLFPLSDTSFYCRLPDETCLFYNGSRFYKAGKFDPILDRILFVHQNTLYYIDNEKRKAWKTTGKNFTPLKVDSNAWQVFNNKITVRKKSDYFFLYKNKCFQFKETEGIIKLQEYFTIRVMSRINDFHFSNILNSFFVATSNGFKIIAPKHFQHMTFPKSTNIVRAFIEIKPNVWFAPEHNYPSNEKLGIDILKIDPYCLFINDKQELFYSRKSYLYRYNILTSKSRLIDSIYSSLSYMTYDNKKQLFLADNYKILTYTNNSIKPYYRVKKHNARIYKFCFMPNKRLLVATSKGLMVTDLKHEEFILKDCEVRELFDDSLFIFIGTYGQGAYLLDKRNYHLIKLPLDKNGCLNYSHSILLDKNGFFWISTNDGIVRLQRQSLVGLMNHKTSVLKTFVYNKNDGLETLEMNGGTSPSAAISGDYFYFASMKGIIKFNPYSMPLPQDSSKIFIEELMADGISWPDSKNRYVLPSNTKQIKFIVASPSILNSQNSEINYRIKQLDTNWIVLNNSMEITFLGLPNGKYELQVRKELASQDNVYTETSLLFSIEQFYYQTWWFKALMVLLIFAIGILIIFLRSVYLRKQNLLLSLKVKEQTGNLVKINQQNDILISVLAHDIRSPIKSMEFLTNHIIHKLPKNDGLLSLSKSLLQSIKTIDIYSSNHLAWYNMLKGSLVFENHLLNLSSLIEEVVQFHQVSIENGGITLNKVITSNIIVNSSYNGLFIILTNLIDNALKHTTDKYLKIEVEIHDETLVLSISNGIGEHQIDDIRKSFNYIKSIDWEHEAIRSNKRLGLTIISFISSKLGIAFDYEISKELNLKVEVGIQLAN
jgi:signal transduction histidine kinase